MRWFSGHKITSASPTKSEECLFVESLQSKESNSLSITGYTTLNITI